MKHQALAGRQDRVPFPPAVLNNWQRAALAVACLLPFCYFAFFSKIGGMPWDYSLVYVSETTPGIKGALYLADPLRVYTNIFYHAGYYLSKALGSYGGWIGYHLIYAALWSARSILIYLISRRMNLPIIVCIIASLFTSIHGSDTSIGHVGQINQFGVTLWVLLSFYFLQLFAAPGNTALRVCHLLLSMLTAYLALWSHEASLLGLIAAPVFVLVLAGWKNRLPGLALYLTVPAYYSFLFAERMLFKPTGLSYQEAVLRKDLSDVSAVISDLFYMVRGLFWFPGWYSAKSEYFIITPQSHDLLVACLFVGIVTFAIALLAIDRGETDDPVTSETRLLTPFLLSGLMCVLFLLPFDAMPMSLAGYWRTQILPSPWAALMLSIALFWLCSTIEVPWQKRVVRLAFAGVICLVGFSVNTLSYNRWAEEWEKVRSPIERLVEAVPQVKDGTVILLQDVPPTFNAWGSNFWFDILLRLAYPHTKVAGSYSYSFEQSSDPRLARLLAEGGKVINGQGKLITVAPHGHFYFIRGNSTALKLTYLTTLIDEAPLKNTIVLKWTGSGPFKIVADADQIDAADKPAPDEYNPQSNITGTTPQNIAKNRFFYGLDGAHVN